MELERVSFYSITSTPRQQFSFSDFFDYIRPSEPHPYFVITGFSPFAGSTVEPIGPHVFLKILLSNTTSLDSSTFSNVREPSTINDNRPQKSRVRPCFSIFGAGPWFGKMSLIHSALWFSNRVLSTISLFRVVLSSYDRPRIPLNSSEPVRFQLDVLFWSVNYTD